MGKINWSRLALGGLLAGVVIGTLSAILIPMFASRWNDALTALGGGTLSDSDPGFFAAGAAIQFAAGILMIWLYAAIRPRYGAGIMTAVRAGVAFWAITMIAITSLAIMTTVTLGAMLAIHGPYAVVYAIAATAGAWVYREPDAQPAEQSSPREPVHT